MSNPPVIKYPLDLTGLATSNLISGELHTVSVGSQPAFVLNYGPFYTTGLVLTRMDTGAVLRPSSIGSTNGQYVATQLLVDMSLRTGLDICSVIVLTDTTLPPDLQVSVTYQVLGGPYSASVDAIQQLIDALDLGNQPVNWGDILGKPVLFPPAPHLHDLGDIYGFEYLVAALERIVQAIYIGDDAQLTAIYAYIDNQIAGLQSSIAANSAALTAHLANYSNPHRVTATQVGLGNVQNYPIASTADAEAGTSNVEYMTPALTAAAITSQIGNAFNAHIVNYNNPHQVTAAQVGLGNVSNYPMATDVQAEAGTNNASLMSPYLTAEAITTQALTPLNAHINNLANPHQTTATQVGLGLVNNYATATNAQGQTGTATNLYMTPASTAAAITSQVGTAFAAHIANLSNPHQTTAAQVGLGNVNNTSDANKPVSTAQQAALNLKASLNAAVAFSSVNLGTDGTVTLYEYTAGGLAIRTGSTAVYTTLDGGGNLTVGGEMVASNGFQVSDERLKDSPELFEPRELWNLVDYVTFTWNADSITPGKKDKGVLAGKVLEAGLEEFTTTFRYMTDPGNMEYGIPPTYGPEYRAVNYSDLGFEMALAAGRKADRVDAKTQALEDRLAAVEAKLQQLGG
jgi:hypothetical protein